MNWIDELINKSALNMAPYNFEEDQPNIRESYYLNNWYRYKKDLNDLDYANIKNAQQLFKALKELSEEDREFLAMKYDRPLTVKNGVTVHPSDKNIAKEINIPTKRYATKRRLIQKKLKEIMIKQKMEDSKK